jgi:hypothetical protein
VPSASRRPLALVLGLAAAAAAGVSVSGCQTTQDAAARIHVRSARELAGREKLKLGEPSKTVKAGDVTVVSDGVRYAVAVALHNTGSQPAHDLPLGVGVRGTDGYLNDEHSSYFQTHIPALDAGQQTTWVYTAKGKPPAGDVFAEVGSKQSAEVDSAGGLPELDLSGLKLESGDSGTAEVEVSNPTDYPQYDLDVFAWATKDGGYVAGGRASAGDLEPDETERVKVRLIGDAKGAELHVAAPPTIFE